MDLPRSELDAVLASMGVKDALAEEIDIFMPDEKTRRLGQSVAAAQIPVVK